MRQNLIVALLGACVALLLANLLVTLGTREPVVLGQEAAGVAGGGFIMATSAISQNEPVVFVLNTAQKRLAVYGYKGTAIDFKGVREITYDLIPAEFSSRGRTTVEDMRKHTAGKK